MKMDELTMLEVDELDGRLRTARRELYELRFKHAVGQLENSSQISKVRHDIARIMTVLRQRDFGVLATAPVTQEAALPAPPAEAADAKEEAKPKRSRKRSEETK